MRPLWIIDLTDLSGEIRDFYKEYWKSFCITSENKIDEPWYYLSDSNSLGLIDESGSIIKKVRTGINTIVEKYAKLLLSDAGKDRGKLIKFPYQITPKFLDVIIVGELKNDATRYYFHLLAAELRKRLNSKATTWIGDDTDVFFYGILYLPSIINRQGDIDENDKVFLNQLHNLMRLGYNNRPFHNLFIFQSDNNKKKEIFRSVALTILHISSSEVSYRPGAADDEIAVATSEMAVFQTEGNPKPILNTGCAGVFLEKIVQEEQEAFALGFTIMDSLVNNASPVFFNTQIAELFANKINLFENGYFEVGQIASSFCADTKQPIRSRLYFKAPVKFKGFNFQELWARYYNDFLLNLKKNLINETKRELIFAFENFKILLVKNQQKWLQGKNEQLEKGVFSVFEASSPHPHCSLLQARKVAECCRNKIGSEQNTFLSNDKQIPVSKGSGSFVPFPLDDSLKAAYRKAKTDYTGSNSAVDDNKIISDLEVKISGHPVFYLAKFLRAFLIGLVLMFIAPPVIKYLGGGANPVINLRFLADNPVVLTVILFLIPFIIFFWQNRQYANH